MGIRLVRALRRAALVMGVVATTLWLQLLLIDVSLSRRLRSAQQPADDDPLRFAIGGRNIFFIEPTCVFQEMPWFGLTSLQECAVESAVRHNEGHNVYVLHTCAFPYLTADINAPNGSKTVYAPLDFFFANTELQPSIISSNPFRAEKNSVEHAKDILSVVTLWKYGGTCLSLDSIIQRPLRGLAENWLLAAESHEVSLRALALSAAPQSPGRQVAAWVLRSLQVAAGEGGRDREHARAAALVTSMLDGRCRFHQVDITTVNDCYGITLLPERMFVPVPEDQWRHLYLEHMTRRREALLRNAIGVCFYHEMTDVLFPNPNAAFATLAREHCPSVSNRSVYMVAHDNSFT